MTEEKVLTMTIGGDSEWQPHVCGSHLGEIRPAYRPFSQQPLVQKSIVLTSWLSLYPGTLLLRKRRTSTRKAMLYCCKSGTKPPNLLRP